MHDGINDRCYDVKLTVKAIRRLIPCSKKARDVCDKTDKVHPVIRCLYFLFQKISYESPRISKCKGCCPIRGKKHPSLLWRPNLVISMTHDWSKGIKLNQNKFSMCNSISNATFLWQKMRKSCQTNLLNFMLCWRKNHNEIFATLDRVIMSSKKDIQLSSKCRRQIVGFAYHLFHVELGWISMIKRYPESRAEHTCLKNLCTSGYMNVYILEITKKIL